MLRNRRKTNVFEGLEAPQEGQVGPKMTPSWAKMGSGSELDVIFGHLRTKMAVKFDVNANLRPSWADLGAEEGDKAKKVGWECSEIYRGRGALGTFLTLLRNIQDALLPS